MKRKERQILVSKLHNPICISEASTGTAGVVVSCKIPILATRVRFPGSARFFYFFLFLIFNFLIF